MAGMSPPPRRRWTSRVAATVSVLVATSAGVVAMGGIAEAHTGTLSATAVCNQTDGSYTITYSGSTANVPAEGPGHVATFTVGEVQPTGSPITGAPSTVTGNTTYSFVETVDGSATYAQATAFLAWGDGVKSDPIGAVHLPGNCGPSVTPVSPTATPEACSGTPGGHDLGAITFPTPLQTGVDHWTISNNGTQVGGPVTTGSVAVPAGTYVVTAYPAEGYSFGDAPSSFTLTVAPAGDCLTTVQPVAPNATAESCTGAPGERSNGAIVFPADLQTGVDHWTISQNGSQVGDDVTTGSVSLPAGTYVVTASPATNYTFGDNASAFTLTIESAGACNVTVPVVAPTATPEACTGPGTSAGGAIDLGDAQQGVAGFTITRGNDVVATAVSGTVPLPAGDYVATAHPSEGYSFGENQSSFPLTVGSAGSCVVAVELVAPSVSQADCVKTETTATLTPATYTLPAVTGVDWALGDDLLPVAPGTYPAAEGTVVVTALARPGYELPGGARSTEFTLTIDKAPACVLGTKIVRPSQPPTVRPSVLPSVAPTALPFTGSSTGLATLIGLTALTIGGALSFVGRRRREALGRPSC
jgi:LPXTG-motif cell wall-anchored protein